MEFPGSDAEAELQLICNALPVLVARVDAEERFCFTNEAHGDWFGLSQREIIGRTLRQVLGDEAYGRVQPHLRAAFGGSRQSFEWTLAHPDGSRRAVRVEYVPRPGPDGVTEGLWIVITEMPGRERVEEQIRSLNADLERRVQERTLQLESTNREMEAFCYSVSHDLRAPLRAVRGFTEVLLEQYAPQLDQRGRDFLQRVSEASSQMDRLVDDLLRLSRVSRTEVQAQEVNLSGMADQILSELKKGEPGRQVETLVAPDLRAHADERLVRLVMDNLLRNAWKFTGPRAPARIEFGQVAGPDSAFYVRDNGVGFDMTYAGRLFGVFQRLHSASEFPGSGVGLAIVQRVINRHGGRVWAEGTPAKGAVFYFTLPADRNS